MLPFLSNEPDDEGKTPRHGTPHGFVVDRGGRVVPLQAGSEDSAVLVRLEDEQVLIEIRTSTLSVATTQILQQWLLTMLGDDRAFVVADRERSKVSRWRSAFDVIDLVTALRGEPSSGSSSLDGAMSLVAGQGGITHLVGAEGIPGAVRLVRSGDRIAFLPEAERLTVVATTATSDKVLAYASAWLSAQGSGPIRLRIWHGQGWINETLGSGSLAGERLHVLARLPAPASALPAYVGRRIRPEHMGAKQIEAFAPLLSLAGSSFSLGSFASLLRRGFESHLFLTGIREGHGRHVHVGPGIDHVGPAWPSKALGQRVVDQPDRAFGAQVNERLVATVREGAPHIEDITATVRESDDDLQLGDTRLARYLRIAVPCRSGGENLVVSYSAIQRWDEPAAA
jgi:hypothetical protein